MQLLTESSNADVIGMFASGDLPDHTKQWGNARLLIVKDEYGAWLYRRRKVNGKIRRTEKIAFRDDADEKVYVSFDSPKDVYSAKLRTAIKSAARAHGLVMAGMDFKKTAAVHKSWDNAVEESRTSLMDVIAWNSRN